MTSLAGPEAFDAALQASRGHPGFVLLEVLGLGVPIVVHTVLGLTELVRARPNNVAYGYFDNLKYLLQRVAGVALVLWIGAHVAKARLLPAVECNNPPRCGETWAGMHAALSEPLTMTVYLLGMLAIAYHLANGLYTAAMRWGLVVSDAGRRRMQALSATAFAVLIAMFAAALWGFRPFQDL